MACSCAPRALAKKASVPRVADQDELDPRPLSTRARVKIATHTRVFPLPSACLPQQTSAGIFRSFFLIQNAEMMLACFPLKFK